MVFCNINVNGLFELLTCVTILILIDGFLQFNSVSFFPSVQKGHNPYFNRWFSAIIIRTVEYIKDYKSQSLF